MLGRAGEEAKERGRRRMCHEEPEERGRRRPGLLPRGHSHVKRSEEERDMGVVRERFRKDKGGAARPACYGSLYDDLVLRRHLRPPLAARRANYGSRR